MNCSDWQTRIAADETDDPAVAEHVKVCVECREFACDLAMNMAALRSVEIDPSAYVELRARVMAAIEPKRRFGWLWSFGAAVAAAACLAVIWWTAPLRGPATPRPQAVVYSIPAPLPVERTVAVHRKKLARKPAPLTAIKLLTDDPNVVIIWLVDEKKGD